MAKHHYAAKFYLDGFCDETHKDPRRKVWVVDLQDQKISRVRPRDCAFVDDLYDASGFEPLLGRDFEKYLSVFESRAAPVRNLSTILRMAALQFREHFLLR